MNFCTKFHGNLIIVKEFHKKLEMSTQLKIEFKSSEQKILVGLSPSLISIICIVHFSTQPAPTFWKCYLTEQPQLH